MDDEEIKRVRALAYRLIDPIERAKINVNIAKGALPSDDPRYMFAGLEPKPAPAPPPPEDRGSRESTLDDAMTEARKGLIGYGDLLPGQRIGPPSVTDIWPGEGEGDAAKRISRTHKFRRDGWVPRRPPERDLAGEADGIMAGYKRSLAEGPAVRRLANGTPESGYDTELTQGAEAAYPAWKQTYAPHDSGGDYDLRGAYAAGLQPSPQNGHWVDTFKKPNHETFSDESQYARDEPSLAGHWGPGEENYVRNPSAPAQFLQNYMNDEDADDTALTELLKRRK